MFDTIIKVLKEQKGVLITFILGLSLIGAVIGFFKKEKVKVREIEPTAIYREEVLSKLKNEESIKPENIEEVIKEENKVEENKIEETKVLNQEKKDVEDLKIEKTPMDDLLEK